MHKKSVLWFNFQDILQVLCVHPKLLHQSNPRHQTTLLIKQIAERSAEVEREENYMRKCPHKSHSKFV